MQVSIHADMKSMKKAIFQEEKTQNQSIFDEICFKIQLQMFP